MTLEEIKIEIASDTSNLEPAYRLTPDDPKIMRKLVRALGVIDNIVDWNCAEQDYKIAVPAGKSYGTVLSGLIFKPISCIVTLSNGSAYPLGWLNMTDFRNQSAVMTSANSEPLNYSMGGNRVYVGPGLMQSAVTLSGEYRRRLSIADVDNLPGELVISCTEKLLFKKGSPEAIAAWSSFKDEKLAIQESYKITSERRSIRQSDEQIENNRNYINSLS